MLRISKGIETAMIVIGLAAGITATFLCIWWTFFLHRRLRSKHLDESGAVLATTNQESSSPSPSSPCRPEREMERNAKLLASIAALPNSVPLPPPSSFVPVRCSMSVEGSEETNTRKRKFYDGAISLEESHRIEVAKDCAILPTINTIVDDRTANVDQKSCPLSRRRRTKKYTVRGPPVRFQPSGKKKAGNDPFSYYDEQYQTAFVQKELHATADMTARWKICARRVHEDDTSHKTMASSEKPSFFVEV